MCLPSYWITISQSPAAHRYDIQRANMYSHLAAAAAADDDDDDDADGSQHCSPSPLIDNIRAMMVGRYKYFLLSLICASRSICLNSNDQNAASFRACLTTC